MPRDAVKEPGGREEGKEMENEGQGTARAATAEGWRNPKKPGLGRLGSSSVNSLWMLQDLSA